MAFSIDTKLTGTFSGGNPQLPENIIDRGDNNYIIKPECESDSPAYKFRLDVNLHNSSKRQIVVNLLVDWQDPSRDYLRTRLHTSDEKNMHSWPYFQGHIEQRGVSFKLSAEPGILRISSSPRYDQHDLSRLVAFSEGDANIRIDRFYAEGLIEPVHAFLLKPHPARNRPLILATARCHPYETAGSYCLDGVIRKFMEDEKWRNLLLREFNFLLIPILSVNGVDRGYCRLNSVGDSGIDIGRQWYDGDPICEIIRKIVGRHTVAGYLEFHNWMHPNVDGIIYTDYWRSRKFEKKLIQLGVPRKDFCNHFRWGIFPAKTYGALNWIKQASKATCVAVEYPWFGRTVEQMRMLGAATIEIFASIV